MRQIEVTNMSWGMRIAAALGMALAVGLAVAFVVLSIGIAILLLPVIAVLAAIGWWRWRKIAAAMREQQMREGPPPAFQVIEADYEVIDDDRRPR
jgi:high-affinity Fe2+/Pb2+ permease